MESTNEKKKNVSDQFKIIFSIVKEISEDNIPKATDYELSNEKFCDLLEIAQNEGLIKGVNVIRASGKVHSLQMTTSKVTFKGLQYLHDNSQFMKTYRGLKEIKDWIPFVY